MHALAVDVLDLQRDLGLADIAAAHQHRVDRGPGGFAGGGLQLQLAGEGTGRFGEQIVEARLQGGCCAVGTQRGHRTAQQLAFVVAQHPRQCGVDLGELQAGLDQRHAQRAEFEIQAIHGLALAQRMLFGVAVGDIDEGQHRALATGLLVADRGHGAHGEDTPVFEGDRGFVGHAGAQHIAHMRQHIDQVEVPVGAGQRQVRLQVVLGQGGIGRAVEMGHVQALVHHQQGEVHALLDALQVGRGQRQLLRLGLQLVVDGQQFLVGGLQLLVGGLQFLVGGLQFLVGRLQFLGLRQQLLIAGLQLLDHGLQMLTGIGQLALQLVDDQRIAITGLGTDGLERRLSSRLEIQHHHCFLVHRHGVDGGREAAFFAVDLDAEDIALLAAVLAPRTVNQRAQFATDGLVDQVEDLQLRRATRKAQEGLELADEVHRIVLIADHHRRRAEIVGQRIDQLIGGRLVVLRAVPAHLMRLLVHALALARARGQRVAVAAAGGLALEQLGFLVQVREQFLVQFYGFGLAQKQQAVRLQRVVEDLQHAPLHRPREVDQQIAAADQVHA